MAHSPRWVANTSMSVGWPCQVPNDLVGAVSRTLRNYGRDAQADGCPERFSLEFYRWIYNYDRDSRPRLEAAIARHPHLDVVELGSRAAAQRFVDSGDERS